MEKEGLFVIPQNERWSPISSPPHQVCESSFGRKCLRKGSSIFWLLPGKNQAALVRHCCPKGDLGQWSGCPLGWLRRAVTSAPALQGLQMISAHLWKTYLRFLWLPPCPSLHLSTEAGEIKKLCWALVFPVQDVVYQFFPSQGFLSANSFLCSTEMKWATLKKQKYISYGASYFRYKQSL